MEKLVTIIVPIYNVKLYLERCINSILQQTHSLLEIILVDDGSTDGCSIICEKYKKQDSRIKVIHKQNGGLSDARNAGIDIATGEYLSFIDSDDFIHPQFIEILLEVCEKENLKLSQCEYQRFYNDTEISDIRFEQNEYQIIDGKDFLKEMYDYSIKGNDVVVWNKLYKKEFFKQIRFPKGKINEDEYTTYKILYDTPKIAKIPEKLYYYQQRKESIMNQTFNIKRLDYIEALEEKKTFFLLKKEEELYYLSCIEYMDGLILYYNNVRKNITNSKEIQESLISKYKKQYKELKRKNLSLKNNLRYILFYYNPNIYFYLKNRSTK